MTSYDEADNYCVQADDEIEWETITHVLNNMIMSIIIRYNFACQ